MTFSFASLAGTGVSIHGHNETDDDGNPAGGTAQDDIPDDEGTGTHSRFYIQWQNGPLDRDAGEKPNGAFVEDILEVCRRRLEWHQGIPFACPENDEAMGHVAEAIACLQKRRERRAEAADESQP